MSVTRIDSGNITACTFCRFLPIMVMSPRRLTFGPKASSTVAPLSVPSHGNSLSSLHEASVNAPASTNAMFISFLFIRL